MTKKTRAAITLGVLSVGMASASLLATPAIGWWLGQDLGTWMDIGQSVGTALAHAFNNEWLEIVGILLFVA